MATPNDITNLLATTLVNYSPKIADNITDNNPLLRNIMLSNNGALMYASGGTKITQTLMYAENSTVKWYTGLEVLNITDSQVLTRAEFDWKQLNCNVIMSGLEKIQNSGSEESQYNLIKEKIKAMETTAKNTVATSLFSDGTGTNGKEIGGLQLLVADDPTTGTVGGIPRATYAFWRNQTYDFSSEASGNASATNIQTGFNVLWLRCTRNNDKPNVILADANYYGFFESSLQAIQRITREDKATLGFETLAYKSANIYYDSNCPSNHAYFLNTDYIHYRPKKDVHFAVDREGIKPVNQDGVVIPLYWAGNMTLSNASLQGVAKN